MATRNSKNLLHKVITLNKRLPVYAAGSSTKIGETEETDMAVITYIQGQNYEAPFYAECVIVSGKFIGYDALALERHDLKVITVVKFDYKEHPLD